MRPRSRRRGLTRSWRSPSPSGRRASCGIGSGRSLLAGRRRLSSAASWTAPKRWPRLPAIASAPGSRPFTASAVGSWLPIPWPWGSTPASASSTRPRPRGSPPLRSTMPWRSCWPTAIRIERAWSQRCASPTCAPWSARPTTSCEARAVSRCSPSLRSLMWRMRSPGWRVRRAARAGRPRAGRAVSATSSSWRGRRRSTPRVASQARPSSPDCA
jgi:hypothetical protein